jgi:uncharacterized protein YqeY
MVLKERIEQDLLDCMRHKDEIGRNTLRMVISAMKLLEVEKKATIDDQLLINLIQKEIKNRNDSISDFEKGKRHDLIETARKEILILENYLPEQMPDDQIEKIIISSIDETHALTIADMGKVMKSVLPKITGHAYADKVSQMVRKKLTK